MSDSDDEPEFAEPKRQVLSPADMKRWTESEAYAEYVGFVLALNERVKGKKLTDTFLVSEVTSGLLSVLDTLDRWVRETPPVNQPQRFGNTAFRTWLRKVNDESRRLLAEALPARYLELVRHLQLEYRMEPAGSHGAWSLDDYQFLPFVWGSAQLIGQLAIQPKSFPTPGFAQNYSRDYMFMGCIEFICKVKSGPFHEHSNQLWNISAVPSWAKVNAGLIKMYKAEVLGKFPVVQHAVFGRLLPFCPHRKPDPTK
ncbi:hypothetical protein HPB49_018588 [Dermacentor silvarum]|uniref:Uncharacterized protein n=1 Tax=Dermacentor silvarum TaxID=543639 RepID=A0ACB8CGP7_DERSI|nr:hypothetical protein HPB49_018588 [Dermacentor silvarum]